jgi:hypothetical protein
MFFYQHLICLFVNNVGGCFLTDKKLKLCLLKELLIFNDDFLFLVKIIENIFFT